ncbi:hypothetical protein Tsubulata_018090 [Turnera subulata]|uniref:C2 domain-containing protein n=1 Tax=Turnera subulata TaxID=218843 RepID=A0A9Q0J6P6_9ROSI|nr:hypothetical protein Tsubulata_018090 [Turnera subulata]
MSKERVGESRAAMETKVLEINLISAQDLKPPSSKLRRLQTYAAVWIDPATKLRTRIDRVGGQNPTWNDKFLFKVSRDFLSSETSGVFVEIYAVGCLRNPLIGTVRFLLSNVVAPPSAAADEAVRTPACVALQIRRPSGRFHGVLTIAVAVLDGSGDFAALNGASAIGFRDLMGEGSRRRGRGDSRSFMPVDEEEAGEEEEVDASDGTDSTTSSSSTASTALKDWNRVRDLAGKNLGRSASEGGGFFCGLFMKGRIPMCLSDPNLRVYESGKEN